MTQFLAILRDSFREAVDGFVIYAMLGLSALTMLVVGSMSFTPMPPEEAFNRITNQFYMVPAERGRGSIGVGNVEFKAADVTAAGSGHQFRLTAKGQSSGVTVRDGKQIPAGDSLRAVVATWLAQRDKKADESFQNATADQQRAVTTGQMEEFLAHQFRVRAAITATVKRVEGVAEPDYAFDVSTASGAGVRGWPHTTKIFFGGVTVSKQGTLGQTLFFLEDQIINGLGAGIALLIGVILTAFFVPNMLRKGSLDLLVSKPIGRTPLLIYKYIGGLTFVLLVSAFTIGGVWLVIGVRSGFWDPTLLVLIPILTFSFAILYSVSVLFGVLTRSPIVAMLGTLGFMFVVWLAGWGKRIVDLMRTENAEEKMPSWLAAIIDAANTVLPRYKDLDTITTKLIIDGTLTPVESSQASPVALLPYPDWGTTVGTSLAFIAVMLALACWRFKRRDS